MFDFNYLNSYFPIIIFALSGLTLFAKRPNEQKRFPLWLYMFMTLAFLQPWYTLNVFKQADYWLFSIEALTALVLILSRRVCENEESWAKAAVSFSFATLFLFVFQYPTLGLPFAVPALGEKALIVASLVAAIFLFYGIPPLQLGAVDIGSERTIKLQLPVTLLYRFVLGYYFLLNFQGTTWFISFAEFEPLLACFLLFGLSLSHVTLRLQTNLYRLLAYLSSSLVLSFIVQFAFDDYASLALMIATLLFMPLVVLLNPAPIEKSRGLDLWNLTHFYRYHPHSAKHFFLWLKVILMIEAGTGIALLVRFGMDRHYLAAFFSLVFVLSITSVLGDKQAFVPRLEH